MSVKSAESGINPLEFRNTLGRFGTGVTVVTVQQGEEVRGITVNAFMSVSLAPPLVLVSIDKSANSHALLASSERYGVSILSEAQEAMSNLFAGRPDESIEVHYEYKDGFPLIRGALAHLVCRTVEAHEAGDHTLYIGEVEHLSYQDGKPLLYFGGRYGRLEVPAREPILDG